MNVVTMFALAVLAGAFIALGVIFLTPIVAGAAERLAFGVTRLLAGLVFSLGLILVIVGGAELFTGNNLIVMAWASRLVGGEAAARRLKLRVVAVDRPGLGLSDLQPRRRIGDWPADVLVLARRLGLERFAVLGYSGGGPFAAACASIIPEHLTGVGIISGFGLCSVLPGHGCQERRDRSRNEQRKAI